jgi:hypothetical protein
MPNCSRDNHRKAGGDNLHAPGLGVEALRLPKPWSVQNAG